MTRPGDTPGDTPGENAAAGGPWVLPGSVPSAEPTIDYPDYPGYPPYGASYPMPAPLPMPPPMPPLMPPPYGGSPPGFHPPPFVGGYPGGYPPGYPGGYAPAQPGTNTLAIISLAASVLGLLCCCIAPVVGIVCGTIALNQIKQSRQDGFGMAVAGLVISGATLLIYFIFFMSSMASR